MRFFLYCVGVAEVREILTDTERRAVPLQSSKGDILFIGYCCCGCSLPNDTLYICNSTAAVLAPSAIYGVIYSHYYGDCGRPRVQSDWPGGGGVQMTALSPGDKQYCIHTYRIRTYTHIESYDG